MKLTSLSLVFPAYNEEANIENLVRSALQAGTQIAEEFEIIVVNDGSKDKTAEKVTALSKADNRVQLLNNPKNLGYGQTVWNGLQAATKEWVFFSDSDLQFDLTEIGKLAEHASDFDVVIGYRAPRRDPFMRLANAKAWNFLVWLLFGLKIKDLDCAFKLFRRSVLTDLEIRSGGATFSAELMTRLQQQNITFKEVPVTHLPRQAGSPTGAKPAVIIRAFKELATMYRTSNLARPFFGDVFKFGAVGLLSTIIDFFILNFLTYLGLTIFWAIFWAYFIGSINGYLLNNHWTYRRLNRQAGVAAFTQYAIISFVGLGLTEAIIYFMTQFNLNLNLDKIVAVVVVFVWNFFANRLWTFGGSSEKTVSES